MTRFSDWTDRLAEFIESRQSEPFAFGSHDCCMFSARAVEALTGVNPAESWHYTNEVGAQRLLQKHGGVEGLATEALGEPVHPSLAGRGDLVCADLDGGPTIGVCLGMNCAFACEPSGLTFRPRSVARLAWKV